MLAYTDVVYFLFFVSCISAPIRLNKCQLLLNLVPRRVAIVSSVTTIQRSRRRRGASPTAASVTTLQRSRPRRSACSGVAHAQGSRFAQAVSCVCRRFPPPPGNVPGSHRSAQTSLR